MRDPRMTTTSTADQHSAFSKVMMGAVPVPDSMALTEGLHLVGHGGAEHGNVVELGRDFRDCRTDADKA